MSSKNKSALADAHHQIRNLRNELAQAAQPLRERIRELEAENGRLRSESLKQSVRLAALLEQARFYKRQLVGIVELSHHLMARKDETE